MPEKKQDKSYPMTFYLVKFKRKSLSAKMFSIFGHKTATVSFFKEKLGLKRGLLKKKEQK
jgi:hypothetical protein